MARVKQIAERVGRSEGVEVVDVELTGSGRHRILRIYIDKPGGISHADCENISEQVGAILDVEDAVPGGSYILEVSSPGVERKLARPEDFRRFQGNQVRIVLREPVEGRRRWEGKLAGFADGMVTLEPAPGKQLSIHLDWIAKANLKFEW